MRPDARVLAVLLLAAVAGCTALPVTREREPEPVSQEQIQAAQLVSLLGDLEAIVGGTPTRQAEVMAAARQAFEDARQGPAALRYGLLLAAPVHPSRNPTEAQQVLRESLARPELLTGMERALASVELERVTAELRLGEENQRLLSEGRQQRDRQRSEPSTAALSRQLQAAQEEAARLRKELTDAREKLDAIAEFERRQADRPPSSEGRSQ